MIMEERLGTEDRNERTMQMDEMPLRNLLQIMNQEDAHVISAVKSQLPQIEQAVQAAIESFQNGGRLLYAGAGTSGRLAVLDAVECKPTFGMGADRIRAVIAGGQKAVTEAVEGAEDDYDTGVRECAYLKVGAKDTVIALAASGRTPYAIGFLKEARARGAKAISISCNKDSLLSEQADIAIEPETGPEVLTGSTRLKAGTAQKLILNMISTSAMVGIGKVYQNLMVDLQPTNEKLVDRSKRIVMEATNATEAEAMQALNLANNAVKPAIVMLLLDCSNEKANQLLAENNGFIKEAVQRK